MGEGDELPIRSGYWRQLEKIGTHSGGMHQPGSAGHPHADNFRGWRGIARQMLGTMEPALRSGGEASVTESAAVGRQIGVLGGRRKHIKFRRKMIGSGAPVHRNPLISHVPGLGLQQFVFKLISRGTEVSPPAPSDFSVAPKTLCSSCFFSLDFLSARCAVSICPSTNPGCCRNPPP